MPSPSNATEQSDSDSSKSYSLGIHDRITKLETQTKYIKVGLDEIKGNIQWAVKIVLTAVFGAILAGVLVKFTPSTQQSQQSQQQNQRQVENRQKAGQPQFYEPETNWQFTPSPSESRQSSSSHSVTPSSNPDQGNKP